MQRPTDGRVQNFVTPGLMLSKFKFQHDSRSRNALNPWRRNAAHNVAIPHLQSRACADDSDALLTGPIMGAPRVDEFALNQTKHVLRRFLLGGILPAVAVQNWVTMQPATFAPTAIWLQSGWK